MNKESNMKTITDEDSNRIIITRNKSKQNSIDNVANSSATPKSEVEKVCYRIVF